MALRARKPSMPEKRRAKIIVFGPPGVGKTMFLLGFPGLYLIDTEGGTREAQYKQKMLERGIVELTPEQGSNDFDVVIDEFKTLATTSDHGRQTAGLDSFSHLYLSRAAEAEESVGNEFGKDKKEAQRPTRQLMKWISRMDMNVILVCHMKEKWHVDSATKERKPVGMTFDGWDKMEHALDLSIEAAPGAPNGPAIGIVRKTRLREFPAGDRFPLVYEEFAARFGREHLEQIVAPIELASPEEVAKLRRLVRAAQITEEVQGKWLAKTDAEALEDMPRDTVLKCIDFCESKITNDINVPSEKLEVASAV